MFYFKNWRFFKDVRFFKEKMVVLRSLRKSRDGALASIIFRCLRLVRRVFYKVDEVFLFLGSY